MSKFLLERSASMAIGNTCAFCNTHKHPRGFVNLLINDRPPEGQQNLGRLYGCASCIDEMTHLVGGLAPDQVAVLHGQLDELGSEIERVQIELQAAKENMSVPLAEVIDFVREKERRRPAEPAPSKKGA